MNKYRILVIQEGCCGTGGVVSDDIVELTNDTGCMAQCQIVPRGNGIKVYGYKNASPNDSKITWVLIYQ